VIVKETAKGKWRIDVDRLGLFFHIIDRDLNLALGYPDRITPNLNPRVVGPGAVRQAKAPGMPRTGHNTIFDITLAQGIPHVRAGVINRVDLALVAEEGDQFVGNLKDSTFALGQFFNPANGMIFSHATAYRAELHWTERLVITIIF
jgi:hypothetical protein